MAETIEIRPSATKSSTGKSMTMGGMALVRTLSWPTYLLYSAIFLTLGILILAGGAAVGALLSNIVFDGRYVWLPIKFENDKPRIRWMDTWDLSFFDRDDHRN